MLHLKSLIFSHFIPLHLSALKAKAIRLFELKTSGRRLSSDTNKLNDHKTTASTPHHKTATVHSTHSIPAPKHLLLIRFDNAIAIHSTLIHRLCPLLPRTLCLRGVLHFFVRLHDPIAIHSLILLRDAALLPLALNLKHPPKSNGNFTENTKWKHVHLTVSAFPYPS